MRFICDFLLFHGFWCAFFGVLSDCGVLVGVCGVSVDFVLVFLSYVRGVVFGCRCWRVRLRRKLSRGRRFRLRSFWWWTAMNEIIRARSCSRSHTFGHDLVSAAPTADLILPLDG